MKIFHLLLVFHVLMNKFSRRRVPQVRDCIWHWEGSWEAILRVLQRQSGSIAWSALQHEALGLVLDAPGTTKGAQTFRLVNSAVQALLCALAMRLKFATTKRTNKASWDPETDFGAAAMTSNSWKSLWLYLFTTLTVCVYGLDGAMSLFMVKFGEAKGLFILWGISTLRFSAHNIGVAWQLNMRIIICSIFFPLFLGIYCYNVSNLCLLWMFLNFFLLIY